MSPALTRPVADMDWRWVNAAPFRAHLCHLVDETGLPWRVLAGEAGLPDRVVRSLLHGRAGRPLRRIAPHYARRLLRLTASTLSEALRELVPATASHTDAHLLLGSGWSTFQIAAAAGLTVPEAEALLLGRLRRVPRRVQALLAAAVRAHGLQSLEPDPLDPFSVLLESNAALAAA